MPYFSHNGRRLYFTDSGGQGDPLLLLHGLGSRGTDWQPQIDSLGSEYRVLALDFPGHGDSEVFAGPISMAVLAEDALALLDHLGIDLVHVAGLSLGGMVALQILADSADRLRSITVINSGPGLASGRWRMQLLLVLRTLLIRGFGLRTLAKRIAPKLFPRADQQPLRARFLQSVAAADEKTYLNTLRAIGAFDVWRDIAGSSVPALILSADNDYTPVSYKSEYAATMGSAQLSVIENSGHASPMDQPDQCNTKIRAFLRAHSVKEARPRKQAITE